MNSEAVTEFENSLTLWLPNTHNIDKSVLIRLNNCNRALADLLDMRINWDDYLDILQTNGVDMDDYLDISHENLIGCGF